MLNKRRGSVAMISLVRVTLPSPSKVPEQFVLQISRHRQIGGGEKGPAAARRAVGDVEDQVRPRSRYAACFRTREKGLTTENAENTENPDSLFVIFVFFVG